MDYWLRKYTVSDCKKLADLFFDTVHTINRNDYSEEQVNVWASGKVDLNQWNRSFCEHYTIVAELNGVIIGFGDITEDGYLDRLFVHKDYQHQGIATAICDELEQWVHFKVLSVHASITAKGFFEKRGYVTIKEQQVERKGVFMKNYLMENWSAVKK